MEWRIEWRGGVCTGKLCPQLGDRGNVLAADCPAEGTVWIRKPKQCKMKQYTKPGQTMARCHSRQPPNLRVLTQRQFTICSYKVPCGCRQLPRAAD